MHWPWNYMKEIVPAASHLKTYHWKSTKMYVNAVSLYKTLEWLCIQVAVACIIQKDRTGVCMSKPISFCIDEWKQFNRIPSKENGAHFELTRFLFVYFAKSWRGEISHATYFNVNRHGQSNRFSRTNLIIANWSRKYLWKVDEIYDEMTNNGPVFGNTRFA